MPGVVDALLPTVLRTAGSFALLCLAFVPLERLFAFRKDQPLLRPGLGEDLAFFLGQYLLFGAAAAACLTWLAPPLRGLLPAPVRAAAARQPAWVLVPLVVLLGDLCAYWGHRLQHRSALLWRFHSVHHTSTHLDWVAAHREHPLDGLYTQALVNLPLLLLGLPLRAGAAVAVFRGLWAIFIHSNVRLPLGPLRYLLGAPELHRWHHDLDLGARGDGGRNFANLCPLLDLLFGTYHAPPAEEPRRFGVPGPSPRGYLGKLLVPLLPRRAPGA